MPWSNGDYPPSYKNQPKYLRDKAVGIANQVLKSTGNEGEAIATASSLHGNTSRNTSKKYPQAKEHQLTCQQQYDQIAKIR
jgi:uncharacterized protein YdaT